MKIKKYHHKTIVQLVKLILKNNVCSRTKVNLIVQNHKIYMHKIKYNYEKYRYESYWN